MSGYTKLFASIVASTVWDTPPAVTKVWVTMLAIADKDGIVQASVPGLAHFARVARDDAAEALRLFLAPDPDSRTPENEGRRIEAVEGGWRLLNHGKYRELMSQDDLREKAAARKQRQRERERLAEDDDGCRPEEESRPVTPCHTMSRGSRHSESDSGSLSGSSPAGSSNPDQTRTPAESTVRAVHPLTGYELQRLFAEIRSRVVGGLPWQSVKVGSGGATSMAEMLNSDPSLRADIRPTIELLFRNAQAGKAGNRSADIVRSPSFAFGAWCDQWTALREELHGVAPALPEPPPERRLESFAVAQERQRREAALDARVERTLEELRPRAPPPNPRKDFLERKKAEAEAQVVGKAVAT